MRTPASSLALGAFCALVYAFLLAPIVVVVYKLIVAGRVAQGAPGFLVSLALVLPLSLGFARLFAAAFELPFQRRQASPAPAPLPHPRTQGVPA